MTNPDAGGEAEIITPIDGQPEIEKDVALHWFAARVEEKPLNYVAGVCSLALWPRCCFRLATCADRLQRQAT